MSDLQAKMASSAYCIAIDPGEEIDLKVAAEVGMMVLLDKPILVLVTPGREPNPGLARIARRVLTLDEPLDSMASQSLIHAALAEMAQQTY